MGQTSAPKRGWADLGPTKFLFRLGQQRSDPVSEVQRGGELFFSSPSPACRTILHAGGTRLQRKKMQWGESVPGVEEAVAGGAAVVAGGGVVAHGRRLQAAMLLFKRRRERFLPLPLSSFSFSVVLSVPSFLFVLGLFFSFVVFGLFLLFPLSRSFSLFSLSLRVPSCCRVGCYL